MMKSLLKARATYPVVPVPAMGSKIKCPSFVEVSIILLSSSMGFCVECSFLPLSSLSLSVPQQRGKIQTFAPTLPIPKLLA